MDFKFSPTEHRQGEGQWRERVAEKEKWGWRDEERKTRKNFWATPAGIWTTWSQVSLGAKYWTDFSPGYGFLYGCHTNTEDIIQRWDWCLLILAMRWSTREPFLFSHMCTVPDLGLINQSPEQLAKLKRLSHCMLTCARSRIPGQMQSSLLCLHAYVKGLSMWRWQERLAED